MRDSVFELNESDNWFIRNKDIIISRKSDEDSCYNSIKILPGLEKVKSVLELGSANGYRLNFLKKILPNCTKYVGVDLSHAATEDGKSRYGLDMRVNSISDFKTCEKFDMVIVNFVLHWVDRANIFNAIANIDGCMSDNNDSILVLGDFLPDFPYKKLYHHRKDCKIYTYKCDYKNVFLSLNTYKLVSENVYNCDDKMQYGNNTNSCSVSILRKNTDKYYIEL